MTKETPKLSEYEVCCTGISYFEPTKKVDAAGNDILVNGNPVIVNARKHAGMSEKVMLTENEAARLLALGGVQEVGSAPMPWDRPPVATVFSVPANASDAETPALSHGDPRPPHEAPTHTMSEQEPAALSAAMAKAKAEEDDEDEEFDLTTASIAEIAAFIQEEKPSVKELVEAIDGDSDLADKVLEAEQSATGGSPRSTLVKALAPLTEESEDEEDEEDADLDEDADEDDETEESEDDESDDDEDESDEDDS